MMWSEFPSGLFATSTGWGVRNQLHSLAVVSTANDFCRAQLGIWNIFVYDQTLCMISPPGNTICDSGNPLVANGLLIGIQTWESNCVSGFPSMHERINHNRGWIESVI